MLLAAFARNPHRGDAVIATFFWVGSTVVIDSVTDFLTDAGSTRVSNTYNLVESVAAGGISMATYVATNVQNFPDTSSNPRLAVRAHLSAAVTDGGALVSAWSGVTAVSAQHRSASGSGQTTTVAAPGAITLGAGSLAYGVTLSNAVVGRDGPPQGFTNLSVQSDASMLGQVDYLLSASGGTVDPRWTWHFTQPSTWLATVLSLDGTPAAGSGNVSATASTSGSDLDPNGYTVTVDQSTSQPLATNGGSATFTGLATGSHTVSLSGVANNCSVSGGSTRTVTVPSGGTASASYTVTCTVPAQAASGITPDVHIGTAGQSGRILIKGFDITNPRHGDALIATFFWNSATTTNIITSVTDVVNDAVFTPVGNTYHLVRFVHSGNLSMATYVATNIQNFPDTNQTPRLAVRATLSDSIVNGGIQLSTWSGVASDFAQAMGPSNAASGSGTSYVADPGAINIGAGALAYGVSVVTLTGLTDAAPPPNPPWNPLNVLSDAFDLEQSNYLVSSSAGSADPRWQRSFSQPSTWVATVLALNPGTAPTNQPPLAAFSSSCSALTCGFTNTSSDPDGSISANSWNFGDGQTSTAANPSHTYAAAGTYTVTLTVTDNQSATNAVSHTVTVAAANQPPTANFTSSCSALTCAFTSSSTDPDGSIASYSWNFGDGGTSTVQNPSHTYGGAGTYLVTLQVTDNQGAQSTVTSRNVTVSPANQAPIAAFTSSCNNLTCSFTNTSSDPDGSISANSWNFGDGQTSTAANPSQTYAAAGTYAVTLTVTDNQSATNAVSHTVTVTAANQAPSAAFTSSCNNLTCSFTNTSSDPDGSISANSWNFGDGQTSTAANPSHTYSTAGTYTVILTVTDNQSATNSVSHTVTVAAANQPPTANFTFTCSGLSCSFTSTSSDPDGTIASYSWTFGDGGTSTLQNPSHTYAAGGSYTVMLTVTDNGGAASAPVSRSAGVTPPNQSPTASFTRSCTGLTCSFTSTSSDPDGTVASYAWTFGDGGTSTVANPSHTYAAGGSYTATLRVTDNQGAASNLASQTFTVTPPNQAPTANFTSSCSGLTCNFTSTSGDPDGTVASYAWTFGDGATSTVANPSHTYAAGGSYTATLRVTDNQGAQSTTASQTFTVTPPNQAPTASFTRSCSALTCSFTSTSSDPDGTIASYSWNFGDGATSTVANPSHTYAAGGSYTATLRVTDNQGATSNLASQTFTVTPPNQAPTANFTSSCSALTCNFTSTSSDPDGSIASYSWTFGDGGTSTAQNPSHSYTTAGTYTVGLRVTDSQGAQSTITSKNVTVTAPNQPPTASFTRSCNGLTCSFNSSGSSDPDGTIASYSWTFGDGATSTAANPSHTYAAGGTYTVTLRVTDNQGAQSPTASQNVTVTPPNQAPTANFTSSCSALTCNFTSTSSDPDGSIASYSWTFGDGGTSTAANPSHTYAAGGTYTVTLRVTDNQGAQSTTTSKSVTITAPNTAPVVNAGADQTVVLGLLYTLNASFTDPDNGPWSYTIDWGDGTTSTGSRSVAGSFSVGHTYLGLNLLGTRTIRVTITDSRGASGSDTKNVTIVIG